MATISGTVLDSSDAPVERIVRAYRRSDGVLSGEAISNAGTGAYSITTIDTSPHTVVLVDGAVTAGDPYWANVVCATHLTGEINSTTFTGPVGGAFTPTNGPLLKATVGNPFGAGTALYCQSTGYITSAATTFGIAETDAYTLSFWFYVVSQYNDANLVFCDTGNISTAAALMIHNSKLCYGWYNDGTATITNNAWHHAEVGRIGGATKWFLDGVQQGSITDDNSRKFDNVMKMGVSGGGFTGYISDVVLTKGVCRHNATFTPPTGPFLHGQSIGSPTENAVIYDNVTPV